MFYQEPVFRPPSEAKSLLVQCSIGCSYKCTFCAMYRTKKFSIRSLADIVKDLELSRTQYGNSVRKIFLLDGNAFLMHPRMMVSICKEAYRIHPQLQRVGCYGHAGDILRRSDEELNEVREAGLGIVYLGVETGDDELLTKIEKEATSEEIALASQKLHNAGITLSATILLGLAGNEVSLAQQHATRTAELVNRMKPPTRRPWYISALSYIPVPDTEMYEEARRGEYISPEPSDLLCELGTFFEHLEDNLSGCIFRSNHASNYLPLQSNDLGRDRQKLSKMVQSALEDPTILRSEWMRGL
ncbi:radical SAM protein [bacterium]|nr:radical SAM protein [bacterium]